MELLWIILIILAFILIPLIAHRLFWKNNVMGKIEFIILKEDHVCENPYCEVLIKEGKPAVIITHWWNRKYPEYYHDMKCARKSPDVMRRII